MASDTTYPVAHEGNPRDNKITITAGSVLSTAQLDLILRPASVAPLPPFFAARQKSSILSSCPDVFTWASATIVTTRTAWNDVDGSGRSGTELVEDPIPLTNSGFAQSGAISRWEAPVDLTIATSKDCYGLLYRPVHAYTIISLQGNRYIPVNSLYYEAIVNSITDSPRAGIISWIDEVETKDVHTVSAYAVVCDYILSQSHLIYYRNESIRDIGDIDTGTIIQTINAVPSAGDKLTLWVQNSTLAGNGTTDDLDAQINGSNTFTTVQGHAYMPPGTIISAGLRQKTETFDFKKATGLPTEDPNETIRRQLTYYIPTGANRHVKANIGFIGVGNPWDIRGSMRFQGTTGLSGDTVYTQDDSSQTVP